MATPNHGVALQTLQDIISTLNGEAGAATLPSIAVGSQWGGGFWNPISPSNVVTAINQVGPAIGDAKWVTDGAISSGQKAFTSATAGFAPTDVGKLLLIAGAGAAGVCLQTKIGAFTSTTAVTTVAAASATVSGANACFGTDNNGPIQGAINQQQTLGGTIVLPAGNFLVSAPLVPAPGGFGPGFTTATKTLNIQGAGMGNTVLICGALMSSDGLLGYGFGNSPTCAQVICSDVTFDGNYSGVANGVFPQQTSAIGALLSIPAPFTSAASQAPNGRYNLFERVEFYRPSGYVSQGNQGHEYNACVFRSCGQPDLAAGGTHYDNLGSGPADCIAYGCTWKDSSGNYADFVSATGTDLIRLIFIGNVSRNHQIGGIYACGNGSIIMGNRLINTTTGSGIGYDAATAAGCRSKNRVMGNVLDNIQVAASGLSYATYGDLVSGNIAQDQAGWQLNGPLLLGNGFAGGNNPRIESDLTSIYIQASAATGGNIYLRPVSGSQRGSLTGTYNAGATQWQTFDDSAVLRNTLDDGVGSMTSKLHMSVGGHLISTAVGTPTTSNLGANVTSVTFTGNDTRGTIAIVMAAGLAANTRVCTATFAASYGATAPKVTLVDQTSTAGLAIVNSYVLAQSTGVSFDLAFDQALVAGTYTIDYIVIG